MKKTLIKITLTVFVVAILVLVIQYFSQTGKAESDGTIIFVLIDESGEEIIRQSVDYTRLKEDGDPNTLFDILNSEFNVVCAGAMYQKDETCSHSFTNGHVILSVETVETDFFNSYIEIYHNGVYSNKGISLIEFKDKDVIELRYKQVG